MVKKNDEIYLFLLFFYLDRQMNNQTAMGRGGRGGGRVKNPSKPPRFSKNNPTQSQVI
jgi:hypothetical protein